MSESEISQTHEGPMTEAGGASPPADTSPPPATHSTTTDRGHQAGHRGHRARPPPPPPGGAPAVATLPTVAPASGRTAGCVRSIDGTTAHR